MNIYDHFRKVSEKHNCPELIDVVDEYVKFMTKDNPYITDEMKEVLMIGYASGYVEGKESKAFLRPPTDLQTTTK